MMGQATCTAEMLCYAWCRGVLHLLSVLLTTCNSSAGVVKMRRGETARVFREVNTHGDVYAAFQRWVDVLAKTVRGNVFAVSELSECDNDDQAEQHQHLRIQRETISSVGRLGVGMLITMTAKLADTPHIRLLDPCQKRRPYQPESE